MPILRHETNMDINKKLYPYYANSSIIRLY